MDDTKRRVLSAERKAELFDNAIEVNLELYSYSVFYAVYNTNTDRVCDVLDISLMRPAETVEFVCPLPPETVEGLRQQMDEYCMEYSGKHLSELGDLRTPPQTSPGVEQSL